MKSLILYTSKYGSTKKIVDYMADQLCADSINLIDNTQINLSSYDQVIIGGAIYYGSIHNLISSFIEDNQDELLTKNIALFLVCMLSEETAAEQFNNNFSDKLLSHSVADGFFGGILMKEQLNSVEKLVTSFTFKNAGTFDQLYFDEVDKFVAEIKI